MTSFFYAIWSIDRCLSHESKTIEFSSIQIEMDKGQQWEILKFYFEDFNLNALYLFIFLEIYLKK